MNILGHSDAGLSQEVFVEMVKGAITGKNFSLFAFTEETAPLTYKYFKNVPAGARKFSLSDIVCWIIYQILYHLKVRTMVVGECLGLFSQFRSVFIKSTTDDPLSTTNPMNHLADGPDDIPDAIPNVFNSRTIGFITCLVRFLLINKFETDIS